MFRRHWETLRQQTLGARKHTIHIQSSKSHGAKEDDVGQGKKGEESGTVRDHAWVGAQG